QDKSAIGFSQPAPERGECIFGGMRFLANVIAQSLGHVELGHIERIALQPARLVPYIRAEIEQPLVLDEAHQTNPSSPGAWYESRRRGSPAVSQPRHHARICLSITTMHGEKALQHLCVDTVLAHPYWIFQYDAVLFDSDP